MLLIDAHLDLSMNAINGNRIKWPFNNYNIFSFFCLCI